MLPFGVLLATWGAILSTEAAPSGQRHVLIGREAVLLAEPGLVAGPVVEQAEWSPDGRYVLAVRRSPMQSLLPDGTPPVFEHGIVLWTRQGQRITELWRARGAPMVRAEMGWLPGTSVAYVLVEQWPQGQAARPPSGEPARPERWLLRVDARRGALRPLGRVAEDTRLLVSPTQALAVLLSLQETYLRIVRPDGSVKPAAPLPDGAQPMTSFWAGDGSTLIVQALPPAPQRGEGVNDTRAFALNPSDGSLTPHQGTIAAYQPKTMPLDLRLRHGSATLREAAASVRTRPLWLESGEGKNIHLAMISSNAGWGRLSPRGDAVLYEAGGAAWVMPLQRVPREAFVAARDAARRQMVISNARQVGLALVMYEGDHHALPEAGASIRDVVQTYVKGDPRAPDALIEGFVYVYGGGPLSPLPDPAKTLLGYIPGPGGRANLFADGHVVWQPDEAQQPGR
jgi:hypothetical protein